jgi:hypothetical protein
MSMSRACAKFRQIRENWPVPCERRSGGSTLIRTFESLQSGNLNPAVKVEAGGMV